MIAGSFRLHLLLCQRLYKEKRGLVRGLVGPEMQKAPMNEHRGLRFRQSQKCVGGLLLGASFFFRHLFASFLVDHLHRQANLAAIVKAQELHFHFLAFLQNV